jgi:hypothetical protein
MALNLKTCCTQKPIRALNLSRIGEGAKTKKFQKFFLKNQWGLERAQNMMKISISQVWAVVNKNWLVS